MNAEYWIEKLGLQEHPEGGFYRVTYTAGTVIAQEALAPGFHGARPASTAIYFLLSNQGSDPQAHFSAFHRLRSDEMWHFYTGCPLVVHIIAQDGEYSQLLVGPDPDHGQQFQAVVKGGSWFASDPLLPDSFALVGCTVAPGFDFAEFELARRNDLSAAYPQHAALIRKLTRR
jgi:hypothetical protein